MAKKLNSRFQVKRGMTKGEVQPDGNKPGMSKVEARMKATKPGRTKVEAQMDAKGPSRKIKIVVHNQVALGELQARHIRTTLRFGTVVHRDVEKTPPDRAQTLISKI